MADIYVLMKTKHVTLVLIVVCSALLLGLHMAAEHYYFYWTYWWYDVLMHGLGGFIVGSFTLWMLTYEFAIVPSVPHIRLLALIGIACTIGVVWEVFEYAIGSQLYEVFDSYVLDTVMDLCMDLCGALVAFAISERIS